MILRLQLANMKIYMELIMTIRELLIAFKKNITFFGIGANIIIYDNI